MVEQITFQTIFQFLQTAGILIGIGYHVTTLRNARAQMWREARKQQGKTQVEMHAGAQWKAEYIYNKLMKYLEKHPEHAT
jgi:hypothetical protein